MEGFQAFLRADHMTKNEMQTFMEKGEEVELTKHSRGSFYELYNEKAPSILLKKLVSNYYPEINENLTEFTEETIINYFTNKNNQN